MNCKIEESIADMISLLKEVLENKVLRAEFSWDISDKTISEIGGRLIEDFILCQLPKYIIDKKSKDASYQFVHCVIPESQRAMEDIEFVWKKDEICYHLLVDVKGHNELKMGSRPNLASIRKCKEFYSDNEKMKTHEFYIFFCRYQPVITKNEGKTIIEYKIKSESFTKKGIFPLKYLHTKNMDPANIGSGGQILLARETEIEFIKRTDADFLGELNRFSAYLEKLKKDKNKKKEK